MATDGNIREVFAVVEGNQGLVISGERKIKSDEIPIEALTRPDQGQQLFFDLICSVGVREREQ